MECKSCYNCIRFDESNPVFVRCKKLGDNFDKQLDFTIENIDNEDNTVDVDCKYWKNNRI